MNDDFYQIDGEAEEKMYSLESRIRYSEVDESRALSLTGVINYLQDCSTFQSEDLGLGIDYLTECQRAWLLSSWQIVIERYPRLGETVTVSTWPYDFKGIYGYRNFAIRDAQGAYLVRANSLWFFFDTQAQIPVRVREEDVAAYRAQRDEKLAMDYAPRRIPLDGAFEEVSPIFVVKHHIDTNHHVNNAQYVEIARELLPDGIKIREIRVEYKKAAVLGDVMVPRICCGSDSYTVALCDTEGKPYAVIWLRVGQKERS